MESSPILIGMGRKMSSLSTGTLILVFSFTAFRLGDEERRLSEWTL
jgi:hypothetical protein